MNEEGFIAFACEHCHTAIEVSPDMVGETTECPACGQKLVIPADPDDGVARRAYAKATLRAYDGAVTITNVAWNVSANRLKLRDLVMDTGSTLVLSGSVVVVSSMEHKDGLGWPGGKYRQIVYEGEGGRVEWRRSGFTLIVR